MIPFFLPYQRAWINDRSRLKLCQKGRQIGLSLAGQLRFGPESRVERRARCLGDVAR
jgi:phage FluMu gp28-like protein